MKKKAPSLFKLAALFPLLAAALHAAPLALKFDDKGVGTILWQGKNYAGDGTIAIDVLWTEDKEGESHDTLGKLLKYKAEAGAKKVVAEYEGAKLTCTYAIEGNRVDLFAEVTNKTKQPCVYVKLKLGELDLPKNLGNEPAPGGISKVVNNTFAFGFRRLMTESAAIALGNWEVTSPVQVNTGTPTETGYPIVMETPRVDEQPNHPIVEARLLAIARRVIAPGATGHFHLSFNFSTPDASDTALCPEVLRQVAKERPMVLNWPDRRSIGAVFIATAATHWPTNPRGFVFGKGKDNDVTTEEGLKEFGEALLTYADNSVKILKEMNAQGVLVWDVEGQEFPHAISYVGDPRRLKETTPEMDRFSDAFFKKYTDAGLRVGITIRPTRIIDDPNNPGKLTHAEVPDPVQEMDDKINYAHKRWGCTMFYLDSNTFSRYYLTKEQAAQMKNVPWVLPVSMMEELHRRHPDMLIIPEWSSAAEYTVTAPYMSVNLRQRGTPEGVREIYPEAFSVVMPNRSEVEQNYDIYNKQVTGGDVLICTGWGADVTNELIKLIYAEAALEKKGIPPQIKGAKFDALKAMLSGTDAWVKYYAADALGASGEQRALPLLTGLLDDSNIAVQKQAIVALGKLHAASPELAQRMMDIVRDPKMVMLAPFAADTLGTTGSAAIQDILELLGDAKEQMQYYAVRATNNLPTIDPAILQQVLSLLDSPSLRLRETIILTLGKRKVTDAVPRLMAALEDKNEDVSIAAVGALGKIGDKRAVEPLVKLFDRQYTSVVIYHIRKAQDTALKEITGEKDSRDAAGWKAWPGQ